MVIMYALNVCFMNSIDIFLFFFNEIRLMNFTRFNFRKLQQKRVRSHPLEPQDHTSESDGDLVWIISSVISGVFFIDLPHTLSHL